MYYIVDLGSFFNILGRERAYAGRGRLFTPHKVTTGYCLELYYWLHGSSHLVTKYRGEDYVEETMAVSRQVSRFALRACKPHPFTVILLTDTLRCQDGKPWKSLGSRETVCLIITLVIPGMSCKFHENWLTRFSITLLTNMEPGNRKIDPEVHLNIPKIFPFVPGPVCKLSYFFHENPFIRVPIMLLTNTDFFENTEIETLNSRVKHDNPKISRLFLLSCPTYPENFMKIRSPVFP